jgi:hypothetical protein
MAGAFSWEDAARSYDALYRAYRILTQLGRFEG